MVGSGRFSLPKKEFWMRTPGLEVVVTGVVVCLSGCGMQFGGSSASSGGLAVVDLDKVASETGKNIQMKEMFQIQENSVKQQLAKAQLNANALLEAKVKEFGEEPTDDQKRELVKFRIDANNVLGQLQNQANTKLSQYMQDQIAKFRAEIKPIAMDIAKKRGLSVVVPKNEGLLLAIDSGVDITDDVIKTYREKRPEPAAAPVAAPAPQRTAKSESAPRPASKAKEGKDNTK
jgi:Skp family chaperone for outer membrane proteins